jgi:hypothetical protein
MRREFTNNMGSEIVNVVCSPISLSPLRDLLTGSIGTIDVQPQISLDIGSDRELAIVETVAKGIRGVARLNHDPSDRQRPWTRLKPMIETLQDRGWRLFTGRNGDIVAVVLAKSEADAHRGGGRMGMRSRDEGAARGPRLDRRSRAASVINCGGTNGPVRTARVGSEPWKSGPAQRVGWQRFGHPAGARAFRRQRRGRSTPIALFAVEPVKFARISAQVGLKTRMYQCLVRGKGTERATRTSRAPRQNCGIWAFSGTISKTSGLFQGPFPIQGPFPRRKNTGDAGKHAPKRAPCGKGKRAIIIAARRPQAMGREAKEEA